MRTYLKAQKLIPESSQESVEKIVRDIIATVKREGDAALKAFSKQFDGIEDLEIQVSADAIAKAYQSVPTSVVEDLRFAAGQIRKFAQAQREAIRPLEVEVLPGVHLGHRVIPVAACGAYVPGGRYPLPSSALMSIIPARVAGVERVVACSPPSRATQGINPVTLVAMDIAEADAVYAMGGAQAIAALAFGTETVKPVDIIVGPGNQYVTEAKRQVSGEVGIDFLAGPSEVLVIADTSANPTYVACDLLAQSEHDPQARGILVTTSEELGQKVMGEVEAWLKKLPTAGIASASWENRGQVVVVDSIQEAIDLANEIAPEHLELQVGHPEVLVKALRNYGSLFIGSHAAEVFGDYVAGTNHILPTMRTSRFNGGVWVGTFLKVVTHQRLEPQGIRQLAPVASRLAEVEGLYGHQAAARARVRNQD